MSKKLMVEIKIKVKTLKNKYYEEVFTRNRTKH